MTNMTLTHTIDTHLRAYCEPDPTLRRQLVEQVWAPEGALLDPPIDGVGHDGIVAMVDAVLAHYPGHAFRRTTTVDTHHDVARYGWELVTPAGEVVLAGIDVADVDGAGRLTRVVGFFGEAAGRDD
jgi:hypothetical protein